MAAVSKMVVLGCSPEAIAAKEAGNEAFAASRFEEAYERFTQAIIVDPDSALLRSNRAGALASLGRHEEALNDALVAVRLQPDWWKGHTRKGHALFHLRRYDESEQSFAEAHRLNPEEKSVSEALARAIAAGNAPGTDLRAAADARAAVGGDFQRVSTEDARRRIEESARRLSDVALDEELRLAGISAPPGATRTEKVALYARIDNKPPLNNGGSVGQGPSGNATPKVKKCCCLRSVGQDQPTPGEQLMERRKRWIQEWSSWDDARLVRRLRRLGIDGEGLSRNDLVEQLLEAETEYLERRTCTPQKIQFYGFACTGVLILGTFVFTVAWLTTAG